MKKFTTVILWLASIFCFLCLPTFGFHVCNIFFVLSGILLIPEGRPSQALKEHLKIKPAFIYVAAIVFFVIGAVCAPLSPESGSGAPAVTESTSQTVSTTSAPISTAPPATSAKPEQTASAQTATGTAAQTIVQTTTQTITQAVVQTTAQVTTQTTTQTVAQTTAQVTTQITTQTTTGTTAQTTTSQATTGTTPIATTYILNTKSKKIHYQGCSAAKKILEANKAEHTGDYSALFAQGYTLCGICFK